MNKAILMSIRPQYVYQILKGNKTVEVRKKFPKDYVGWVYIYCTKGKEKLYSDFTEDGLQFIIDNKAYGVNFLNGKVVARFWCDKVDCIEFSRTDYQWGGIILESDNEEFDDYDNFEKQSCLDFDDAWSYIGLDKVGYAIHITRLEIFDKPMELNEFYFQENCANCPHKKYCKASNICKHDLQKAPQSWCYVEGK